MKTSMYFNYTSRSLLRGGQRTVLAIFCVAVGVMAVVALQLVGFMLQNSLTANVRESNGGDVAVTAAGVPLKNRDLAFFNRLKHNGTISNYTAVMSANGALNATATSLQSFSVEAVDPGNFPIVSRPTFVQPGNGSVANLLGNGGVIVTQDFIDKYQKHVGDTLNVYIKTNMGGSGQTRQVRIAGIAANAGVFAQTHDLLLISTQDYLGTAAATSASYSYVYVTTADQSHTDAAVKAIDAQFPLVSVQTVASVLKTEQSTVDTIDKFLEMAGLLALLIGGAGIINTMQVMLSRRKTEIAMLKTAGYQRRDLYLLFGLETGLLGLIGGIVGAAAATGLSYIVRDLMQNLGNNIAFILNPWMLGTGVVIGCVTALIFGLMPIVQAANVRPLNVIREQETRGAGSLVLTMFLLVLLSLLFCALAIVIMNNNVMLGIEATYGTFAFLIVLGGLFGLVVLAVSKLPVPEHFQFKQIALVLLGVTAAVLVYRVLPVFGICLLAASLLGIIVVLLPASWKVSMKMALRNLGRRRTRTTATMLALFIGIFGIGIVIGVGQDLQTSIRNSLSQNQPYNIAVTTSGKDTSTLQARLNTLPGLTSSREDVSIQVRPVAINGQAPQKSLPGDGDRQAAVSFLSQIEGYDTAQNLASLSISRGRGLNAGDAGTNNVVISQMLTSAGWLKMNLKPGDTITFASADGKTLKTVTVVGVVSIKSSAAVSGSILAPASLVHALAAANGGVDTVFYIKVDPAQLDHALNRLGQIVPNATVQDLTSVATGFIQQLNSLLEMLVAIASLSLIAAVVIIANAVALAMLERRRELGILKSVGYTSGMVLSEVVVENGVIGALGAFLAMLLAAGGIVLLGSLVFNMTLSIQPVVVISLVAGATVLAVLTAALVAWGAVRVRPLEVLRYE
jgi:putative ABC transport system permease protein